jgi:hypothetical protein
MRKNPDNLRSQYPHKDNKAAIQLLADYGIASQVAFTLTSMKAKACFEEATAGHAPLCILIAKSKTYAVLYIVTAPTWATYGRGRSQSC